MMDSSNDLVSPFEENIVSDIPSSWKQDYDTSNVFGWLIPLNDLACAAFHLVVDKMIKSPDSQLHERKFIHLEGMRPVRAASISGSEDEDHQEKDNQVYFFGAFKFSTALLPREPSKGWYIGTGRDKPEVDAVIGPPDSKWKDNRIRGSHARLFIHKESCLATIEALHSMEVSGSTGLKHIDQKSSDSCKVLEHGHEVLFGQCSYLYLQGEAMTNGTFRSSLSTFMKAHQGSKWTAHPILSAPSTGAHLQFDGYTILPGAFAGGSFGEVTAGWTENGSVVAVKRFKQPNQQQLSQHLDIMGLIGHHANILELLHSSSNLEPAFPVVYCVYSPLAFATLDDVADAHHISLAAQIALLIDYLQGLVFLHDIKGIMHRDIKPANLGVRSFDPPRGVILDLDAATTETTSKDHGQGTIPYLAPEIISLKMGSAPNPQGYESSVDVWGMSLSAIRVLRARPLNWNHFDDSSTIGQTLPGTTVTNFVLEERLLRLQAGMEKVMEGQNLWLIYFRILKQMATWLPGDRLSASEALETVGKLAARHGARTIVPRQGIKRKIGDGS